MPQIQTSPCQLKSSVVRFKFFKMNFHLFRCHMQMQHLANANRHWTNICVMLFQLTTHFSSTGKCCSNACQHCGLCTNTGPVCLCHVDECHTAHNARWAFERTTSENPPLQRQNLRGSALFCLVWMQPHTLTMERVRCEQVRPTCFRNNRAKIGRNRDVEGFF